MLQSLRQALLETCPGAVAQDVLSRALQDGLESISLKYTSLQPSEQWQAFLAADVWFVVQTCHLITEPLDVAEW